MPLRVRVPCVYDGDALPALPEWPSLEVMATQAIDILMVSAGDLEPNPWNPNRMDHAMFAKERASIREFGFVDPLTIRIFDGRHQIIDGEHRWKAGIAEGMTAFPCVALDVDDDEARELTVILNDTRGEMEQDRLADLLQDLAKRRDQVRMESILPYDKAFIENLTNRRAIDWEDLEKRRGEIQHGGGGPERWVERVFRMPKDAADVLDKAIEKVRLEEDIDQDWRALELIAADFLG